VVRFPPFNRFLKILLGALAVAYLVEIIAAGWMHVPVAELLSLRVDEPGVWTVWQVVSYPWVFNTSPNGLMGFLITLLFTWWIYGDFQSTFGTRRGLERGAFGVLASAAAARATSPVSLPGERIYGFSVVNWGAIACVSWMARGRPIQLFGAIPLQKGEHLLVIAAGLSVLGFILSHSVAQLASDLAALAAGVLYCKHMIRPGGPRGPRRRKPPKRGGRRFDVIPGGRDGDGQHWLN
jgi:hypothetical protein